MSRMTTIRLAGLIAATALTLTACATAGPLAPSAPASEPAASAPASSQPAASSPAENPEPPADWQTVSINDGAVQWKMPADWVQKPGTELNEADGDFEGTILDPAGTPVITYSDIVQGQKIPDGPNCEIPDGVEVLDVVPVPGLAAKGGNFVAVAEPAHGGSGYTLAAGVSEGDVNESCDPGLLAVYHEGDIGGFMDFELLSDSGDGPPSFDSLDAVRDYLETDEYKTLRQIMLTYKYTPKA